MADKKVELTEATSDATADHRDQSKVDRHIVDMARERINAICQDDEGAVDLDMLRDDRVLNVACKRLPKSGGTLASQPAISRLDNVPKAMEMVQAADFHGLLACWR